MMRPFPVWLFLQFALFRTQFSHTYFPHGSSLRPHSLCLKTDTCRPLYWSSLVPVIMNMAYMSRCTIWFIIGFCLVDGYSLSTSAVRTTNEIASEKDCGHYQTNDRTTSNIHGDEIVVYQ